MFPLIGREINNEKKKNIKLIQLNDNLIYLILAPNGFSQLISKNDLIIDSIQLNEFLKQIINQIGIKNNINFYPSIGIKVNNGQLLVKRRLRQRYILNKNKFRRIQESQIKKILTKNNLDLYIGSKIKEEMIPDWLINRFWKNFYDFKNNANPIIIAKDEIMISICYSAANFDNHSEIDILTLEEYRKNGLASICASKFIENLFSKNITPLWDAFLDNRASCILAERLGYSKILEPYDFYRIYR